MPPLTLSEYKTDPYCLQLCQNMTTDYLFLFLCFYPFLPVFTLCEPKFVLKIKSIQNNFLCNLMINFEIRAFFKKVCFKNQNIVWKKINFYLLIMSFQFLRIASLLYQTLKLWHLLFNFDLINFCMHFCTNCWWSSWI